MEDRFESFDRSAWAKLRDNTPLRLSNEDIEALRGINEYLDITEVEEIYLPLSRLLNLHIGATQKLARVADTFLGTKAERVPYVIGIGGSVAVGKSTTARVLQQLLSHWPEHPRVDLLTTDGFLHPNGELERRSIMNRKGFPESYDTAALIGVLRSIKSGAPQVTAPVYSHLLYDVVPGKFNTIESPDVLIVEGLNVLQSGSGHNQYVSDFFDFSIYVDAPVETIKRWYVERFMTLRDSIFLNPDSYFRHYAELTEEQAREVASEIWESINRPNLVENIAPTIQRAKCILTKGENHRTRGIELQKS